MKVRSYFMYAESGIDWLGKIPAQWSVEALKRRLRVANGSTPKSDEPSFWDGEIPWVTPEDLGKTNCKYINSTRRMITRDGYASCGTQLVSPGSVILSTRAPIGSLAIAAVELCTNQGCRALVPVSRVRPDFAYYVLGSMVEPLQSFGRGTTFIELSAGELGAFRIAFPSQEEQQAIAAFLDRETAKLDTLIAKQERLIELLQEKRQAVISHAVTKGLDPTAPMKDSGVEWLGEVPAHWKVAPLMRLTATGRPIMYGIVLPGPNVDVGIPIVKGGDVRPHRLKLDLLNRTTTEIEAPYARARLRPNDVVYAIRGGIGDAELVPSELENANITQDVARVSPAHAIQPIWLLYSLKSLPVFAQLEQGAVGATIRGINIFDLKRARIPVPPSDERDRIAKYLVEITQEIDLIIERSRRSIDLMREHRAALISAAVTGKIDVREAA